jgi:hypothetical protein
LVDTPPGGGAAERVAGAGDVVRGGAGGVVAAGDDAGDEDGGTDDGDTGSVTDGVGSTALAGCRAAEPQAGSVRARAISAAPGVVRTARR